MLACFQRPCIEFRLPAPLGLAGVFVEQPEDSGEETFAPVGPALAFPVPAAADGVHGRVTRIVGDDVSRLFGSEIEGGFELGEQGVVSERHRMGHDDNPRWRMSIGRHRRGYYKHERPHEPCALVRSIS